MKKTLIGLLALVMLGGMVPLAQAAPSVGVTVRVTITSALDITLVSGALIDFGTRDPGAEASVATTSTVIRNTGSGINETYKMYATSPSGWTAGATPAHNTYVLKAAFHGSQPAAGAFDTNTNTLGEGSGNELTASATVLTIDATQTGLSVPYNAERTIWYKFQPPATSSLSGAQDVTVTITAIGG